MFDLIAQGHRQTPHRDVVPMLISWTIHVIAVGAVIAVPVLYVADEIPTAPHVLAFVVPSAAAPPPPPPPPPPPRAAAAKTPTTPRPVPTAGQLVAPIEAPREITPEPAAPEGVDEGVPGGVEGGVPGGVLGGVVGGIPSHVPVAPPPPPPPPPPPAAPKGPVRIGGEVQAPALVKRVNPEYPDLAVKAQVEGVVILEATVDQRGHVEDVRVIRSIPLLDAAAKTAVRQWAYSPLLLNGRAERFILTVTVSFRLTRNS